MQAGAGLNIVSYSQEKAFGFKFIVGLLVIYSFLIRSGNTDESRCTVFVCTEHDE